MNPTFTFPHKNIKMALHYLLCHNFDHKSFSAGIYYSILLDFSQITVCPRIPPHILPRSSHWLLLPPSALMRSHVSPERCSSELNHCCVFVCPCPSCHSPCVLQSCGYSSSHLRSLCVATAGQLWIVLQRRWTLKEGLLDLCHMHGEWFSLESGISCENKDWHEGSGLNFEDCHFHDACYCLRYCLHLPALTELWIKGGIHNFSKPLTYNGDGVEWLKSRTETKS